MESDVCKYFASFCGADETSATVIDLSWSVFYEHDQFKAVSGSVLAASHTPFNGLCPQKTY